MVYKHPLESAGMAGSEFGSDRLGDNISGQNPWWAEGAGFLRQGRPRTLGATFAP